MISRKLIITKIDTLIYSSLVEDGDIVEIRCSSIKDSNKPKLGDIYVGRVKNIVANIGAAFIEISPGIECYYSLEQNNCPIFTSKIGKKSLCIGDELLVQVQKEAVKTKATTVTSNLNFSGNYVVLTVGNNKIGISSKIKDAKRQELQEIVTPYKSTEYGFIVRTNAKDISSIELSQEIEQLISEYRNVVQYATTRTCFACVKEAFNPYITHIRDTYKEGLTEIIIEDIELFEQVKTFLNLEKNNRVDRLRLYEDKLLPLHKLYSIESTLELALKERIWTKSGAYLIIQSTEALHVIDVNTGKYVNKKNTEDAYYRINLEAAKEAVKQIRLRNLSGIIIIDFINLSEKEHLNQLLTELQKQLKKDPIQTVFIDVTKLQLVEITRKKIRKTLKESLRDADLG